jgi:translocation and assembly module TamA
VTAGVLAASPVVARTAEVTLTVTGDRGMADELKEIVDSLDKERYLSGDGLALLQGAQALRARMRTALRSRGYYDSQVTASFAGQPVDEPAALDAIGALPEAQKANFTFIAETGPRYRVSELVIRPADGAAASLPIDLSKLTLSVGKPADAAEILATEQEILDQLRARGHALAAAKPREVVVDHATKNAEVTYVVEAGPTAKMGPVRFTGTEKIDTEFLQRRVPYREGEPYTPAKVTALRDRLTSLGVFNSVRVKPATVLDDSGELPIEVELSDRLARSIGFGLAYETQLGLSVHGFWLHRNLFGQAESLRLAAEVNHIGQGTLVADFGYAFKADFRKPDWWLSGQDALAQAQALREVLDAYRRKAIVLTVGLDRTFSPEWRLQAGLTAEKSEITNSFGIGFFTLLGVPLAATLNKTNSLVDPTRGFRLNLMATPYVDIENDNNFFTILRVTGTTYLDISGNGRSVLAARASFGTIPGSGPNRVPPDKLFYAGGGGSVRGFAYQTAGPRDAFNTPLGGASVVEGSLEFRQRFGKSFGAVAFVDAGSAYTDMLPDFSELAPRIGTGVGIRYYTDFGPVRLDVGLPLNRRQGDPAFGVYVSLGQAF